MSESVSFVGPSQQHLGVLVREPHARLAQPLGDGFTDLRFDPVAVRHQEEPGEWKSCLAVNRLDATHQHVDGQLRGRQLLRRQVQRAGDESDLVLMDRIELMSVLPSGQP